MSKFDELAPQWMPRLVADLGLANFQAAGLLGNLGFESGGFDHLQEIQPVVAGSRGGLGVAQWTGPRRVAYEAWCAQHNLSPYDLEANYGYLLVELRGAYSGTVRALKAQATLSDSVWSVGQTYERPGGTTSTNLPGYSGRLDYAKRALSAASATQAPLPVTKPALMADKALTIDPSPVTKVFASASVRQLQQRLVALGYAVDVDGDCGPQTCGALMDALK